MPTTTRSTVVTQAMLGKTRTALAKEDLRKHNAAILAAVKDAKAVKAAQVADAKAAKAAQVADEKAAAKDAREVKAAQVADEKAARAALAADEKADKAALASSERLSFPKMCDNTKCRWWQSVTDQVDTLSGVIYQIFATVFATWSIPVPWTEHRIPVPLCLLPLLLPPAFLIAFLLALFFLQVIVLYPFGCLVEKVQHVLWGNFAAAFLVSLVGTVFARPMVVKYAKSAYKTVCGVIAQMYDYV
jgi:hypothetical protein